MSNSSQSRRRRSNQGITSVAVKGYKSLAERCTLDIYPLTILAGANSSGKSSIMQPLLMLKQTLEATYDPGALLLYGPNVRHTSADQLFSRRTGKPSADEFTVYVEFDSILSFEVTFSKRPKKGIEISSITYTNKNKESIVIYPDMSQEDIRSVIPKDVLAPLDRISKPGHIDYEWGIKRSRCFLTANLIHINIPQNLTSILSLIAFPPIDEYSSYIRSIIHVPGLRGNPERTYKTTSIGTDFPGTFENYVASVISHWQSAKDDRLRSLGSALETLGLTWKVEARQVDDTQVELRVGRMLYGKRGGAKDMVSIADVGFGVSQTLPVLVALLVAERGQLVYIEQPEIHLHPRAQSAMAQVLSDAAKRGVRVVVETHSSLLLRSIQTLVARGTLPADLVRLHWFKRKPEDGITEISSATLDEEGAFGDWPEDFDEVILSAEQDYLDAAELKAFNNGQEHR